MAPKLKASIADRAATAGLAKDILLQKEEEREQELHGYVGVLIEEHIDKKRLSVVAVESLQRNKTDNGWLDWAIDVLQSREDLAWRSSAAKAQTAQAGDGQSSRRRSTAQRGGGGAAAQALAAAAVSAPAAVPRAATAAPPPAKAPPPAAAPPLAAGPPPAAAPPPVQLTHDAEKYRRKLRREVAQADDKVGTAVSVIQTLLTDLKEHERREVLRLLLLAVPSPHFAELPVQRTSLSVPPVSAEAVTSSSSPATATASVASTSAATAACSAATSACSAATAPMSTALASSSAAATASASACSAASSSACSSSATATVTAASSSSFSTPANTATAEASVGGSPRKRPRVGAESEGAAQEPSRGDVDMLMCQFNVLDGGTFMLTINRNGTIADAKSMLELKQDLTASEMKFLYSGRMLQDDKSPASYNIQKDNVIHVIPKRSARAPQPE